MSELIEWVDAGGVLSPLSGQPDIEVLWGVEGRFMPPVRFISDGIPFEDGESLRSVTFEPRDVLLPIRIHSSSEIELRSRLRALVAAFNPKAGNGQLRVTGPDGATRLLTCRYSGGLELSESEGQAGVNWQRFVAALRAFDPYWYDAATNVQSFTTGTTSTFFPMFPLRLSSSEVFADATVQNDGDVEAWPVWTITGPGSDPVLRNLTSGKTLALDVDLLDGESITIDTRPRQKTITKSDGTNGFSTLTATSSLWPLLDGPNSVRVELSGASAASAVTITFHKRYLVT